MSRTTARILLVSGIRVRHDAISNIMVQQHQMLAEAGYDVSVLVHHVDSPRPGESTVASAWDLIRHPDYLEADVVVFHFGIFYDGFNALAVPHPRGAIRVVHFHNITPPALLSGETRRAAEAGLIQLATAELADVVWSDSLHNTDVMCAYTAVDRADVVAMEPSAPDVERRARIRPVTPHGVPSGSDYPVQLVSVGRFVEAKGLTDLVEALGLLDPPTRDSLRLTLAGSVANSDSAYLQDLRDRIADTGLSSVTDIVADPSDDELIDLLWRSDVFVSASHHEGFCIPAIEALATGCRAIVTDVGALPDTVGPCGVVVPAHDPPALAVAVAAEVATVRAVHNGDAQAVSASVVRDAAVRSHLDYFSTEAVRARLLAAVEVALDRRRERVPQ